MVSSIRDQAANAAALSARAVVGRAQPAYADRMARFDALASTVLDASGKASEAERVQAYQSLQSLSASGGLAGIDDERRKVLDRATFESDIGQRAQGLQRIYVRTVNAAGQAGGGADAALRAAVSNVDSLPAEDQELLFRTGLNVAGRSGTPPFANLQDWRENTTAQAQMVSFMREAGVIRPNGVLDQKAAQAKAVSDPKFAAALRLSMRSDNTSPDWTQAVSQLFAPARAPDRVDLSPAAQAALAEAAPARPAAPQPAPYRQGSLASITA